MGHTYREFFYHFAWATRGREPVICSAIEPAVHGYVAKRCSDLGVFVYIVNGIEDHVHLVCSIPPRWSVAEVLDRVKGGSAHHINHRPDSESTLYWQRGYGGLTFAKKDLSRVVEYVKNQKQHHRDGTLWESLEQFGDDRNEDRSA